MASVRRARRGASPPHDLRGDRRRGVAVHVRVDAVGRPPRRRAQPARHRLGREPRDLEHPLPAARAAGSGCGARLVVVDPRRTAMARRADRHLALRPGTDVALVLGIVRHLAENDLIDRAFVDAHATGADDLIAAAASWGLARTADVTGVEAADIAAFAEELASIRPAFIRIGWGLERNRNGGSSFRSVLALPVLTGQLGVLGAGIMSSLSGAGDFSLGNPSQGRRKVNMNQLGTELPAMPRAVRPRIEPGGDRAPATARARGLGPRRPVHGRARPGAHRHRALRGRRASRDDALRGRRPRRVIWVVHAPAGRGGDRRGSARAARTTRSVRGSRRVSVSTCSGSTPIPMP